MFAALLLIALLAAGDARAGAAPAPARVVLSGLTLSPDGGALAVEATCLAGTERHVDTLIVDLSRGSVRPGRPAPARLTLGAGGRLAAADRYALYLGSRAHPESAAVLARLDPAREEVCRLAFRPPGDSVLVLLQDRAGWLDVVGIDCKTGRRGPPARWWSRAAADSAWRSLEVPFEFSTVEPTPFPHLYLAAGRRLFFLVKSEARVPGVRDLWLSDLHTRDGLEGEELVLLRNIMPYESLVSPDSNWMAVAGEVARADFGGGLHPNLWLIRLDGTQVFSVLPEGRRSSAAVTSMGWVPDELWYAAGGEVFSLQPSLGRSRRVAMGPPPPAWCDSLAPPGSVSVRDRNHREAWLKSVGPPGFDASELWLSERHGARQIRLIGAMLFLPPR